MRYEKKVSGIAFASLLILFLSPAYLTATPLNIVDIEQGSGNGFGYSFFHDSSGTHPGSASQKWRIRLDTSQTNTYDPMSGELLVHVLVTPNGSTEVLGTATGISGTSGIDPLKASELGGNTKAVAGEIKWTFNTLTAGPNTFAEYLSSQNISAGDMITQTFLNKDWAGSGTPDPNEYTNGKLSLWGADGWAGPYKNYGDFGYSGTRALGTDIVIKVSIPDTFLFFGSGFLAFAIWRWRQEKKALI